MSTEHNNLKPSKGSTGPKTETGKARSSQNAVKHGLSSQKAILRNKTIRKKFNARLAELMAAHKPSDYQQQRLVQEIALEELKLDLIYRQEFAELRDRERPTVAQIMETVPSTGALYSSFLDWGKPTGWDLDSVVVKTSEQNRSREGSADGPQKFNQQGADIEARLSDSLEKMSRYGRAVRRNRDRLLDQLARLKKA